ncbi:MAG: DNA repair protein RecO [Bacilli bacterium]|nr:DNA repair protein RecO [Bacilli bacterium]
MKIIVLSLTKYKEKDVIINAISSEEYLTFNAHGLLSPTSKFSALNNELTIAEVTLSESQKSHQYSLKDCSVINMPFNLANDIYYMVAINLISEATNKMLPDEEKNQAFAYLERAIYGLKKSKYPLLVAASYLTKMINLAGYSFEINRCVRCGSKKDIVTFSFEDGGYVCKNCLDEYDSRDLTKDQLVLIRTLCGSVDFDFNEIEYNEDSVKFLLDKFIKFINDVGGVELKSAQLIINN